MLRYVEYEGFIAKLTSGQSVKVFTGRKEPLLFSIFFALASSSFLVYFLARLLVSLPVVLFLLFRPGAA